MTVAFWRNTVGFSETVWTFKEGKLPALKNSDAPVLPAAMPAMLGLRLNETAEDETNENEAEITETDIALPPDDDEMSEITE